MSQLTQAELKSIALQAGFNPGCFGQYAVTDDSLAKFAQLIQQRQGEPIYQCNPGKIFFDCSKEAYLKYREIEGIETRIVYSAPVDASQLVAQALEKAAEIVEKYTHDELNGKNTAALIRALIDQPVDHIEESLDMVETQKNS